MGNFLSTLSVPSQKIPCSQTWCQPLQKIKQYHGMFKYICDSFVITNEQCKQIFSSLQKTKIWDPDNLGKIDALQIFCGLVIFSKQANWKKKLSFLFSIFDFNQIKSLSFIDIQVIMLNVCNSVYKILGKNGKVNESQIAQWLIKYLYKKQRVKITQLYNLCIQNPQIQQLFKTITQIFDQQFQFPINTISTIPKNQKKSSTIFIKQQKFQLKQKQKQQIKQNIQWHRDFIIKIIKTQDVNLYANNNQNKNNDLSAYYQNNYGCKISWVFGINIDGFSRPFIGLTKMNGCIMYRISSLAIIQNLSINKQQIIQGHQQQLSCIAYNQKYQIIATVQNIEFPTIYLWKKTNPTSSNVKKITNYSFQKYSLIKTNHSKGIKLMQFIQKQKLLATVGARQHASPIIVYDFITLQIMYQIILQKNIVIIINPLILIQKTQVNTSIFDTFYCLAQDYTTIYQITLKPKKKKYVQNPTLYSISSFSYNRLVSANKINTLVACYCNISMPFLRSYKDKSAAIALITGHESGSLCMLTISKQKKITQKQLIIQLGNPINCIQITNKIITIASGQKLYIYDLDIIKGDNLEPVLIGNTRNQKNLQLLSYNIKYFDFVQNYILAMSDNGQFIRLQTSLSLPPPQPQPQKLKIVPYNKIYKFYGISNIFCLLDLKDGNQMLLYTSGGNKIISIETQTREIQNIWEINTLQYIVALDAICSQQGIVYIVCASQSGRLYIRINWQQSPKFYDCGSDILDVKISKDCSYLLVATKNNYLLFFAQVNSIFTSPRKLFFEYQTPCSINFLDNFKFFLITTSVKNTYLIQIPQLKHKKLSKESTQKISISKIILKYPYYSAKQDIVYSNSYLGASMKFSLLTMKQRDIYFFNNSEALQRGNYTILKTHKCPVSQVLVNQLQNKFYSIGKSDNMLIQWEVFPRRYKENKLTNEIQNINNYYGEKYMSKDNVEGYRTINNGQMQINRMKNNSQIYYFRTTKLDKINLSLQKYYKNYLAELSLIKSFNSLITSSKPINEYEKTFKKQIITNTQHQSQFSNQTNFQHQQQSTFSNTQQDQQNLNKRSPNVSLKVQQIYGFNIQNSNSLYYNNDGNQIIGYCSRFIINMDIKTKKQTIYEPTSKKIIYLLKNQYDGQILYCVEELKPMIYVLDKVPLRTSHSNSILHMNAYKNYIISYANNTINSNYTINMHNYHVNQLLYTCKTDIKITQFILINQNYIVSLNQVRIWLDLYPSQKIIYATAGCLLPNKNDILLGLTGGILGILTHGSKIVVIGQGHEKDINIMKIRQLNSQYYKQDNYQIVTISKDQKIKIWNNNFQPKIQIFLRHEPHIKFINESSKQQKIQQTIQVKSLSIYKNKLLLCLQNGQISQIELSNQKKQHNNNNQQTNSLTQSNVNVSDKSFSKSSISNYQSNCESLSQQNNMTNQLLYKWNNIYEIHTLRNGASSGSNREYFSINPVYPLLATSTCDNKILVYNYRTNQILYKCYYQQTKIQCIKFSTLGNLLCIAFNNNQIKFYQIKILSNQSNQVTGILLKFYQKFILKQNQMFEILQNQQSNINNNTINSHKSTHRQMPLVNFYVINMQFSQCASYFAISYILQFNTKTNISTTTTNNININPKKINHSYRSFINLYKTRQQSTKSYKKQIKKQDKQQNQLQYYIKIDTIDITSNMQNILVNSNYKYIKSVYFMNFVNDIQQINNLSSKNMINSAVKQYNKLNLTKNKSLNISTSTNNLKINSNTNINYNLQLNLHQKKQKSTLYLILHQQYIDINKIRINNDNKIKIKIYQIDQKAILKQDQNINYFKIKFHYYVNAHIFCNYEYVNGYGNRDMIKYYNQCQARNIDDNTIQRQNYNTRDINTWYSDKQQSQLNLSNMLIHNNIIFYGDTKGKIHIVKLNSLLPLKQINTSIQNKQIPSQNTKSNMLQHSKMNIGKYYNSHTTFINQLEISQDGKFLFVSGSQECIVTYRIEKQIQFQYNTKDNNVDNYNNLNQLQFQKIISQNQSDIKSKKQKKELPYQQYFKNPYNNKNNNQTGSYDLDSKCYPLNFKDIHQQYITKNKFYQFLNNIDPIRDQIHQIMLDVQPIKNKENGIKLQPVRIFGRRAFDRRNNLYQDLRGNLIYTLGPNIIVQNPYNPHQQSYIPIDPNPYSNSPQISTVSMTKDYLIAATQQQNSRIFVWDIYSKTCLSQMRLKNFAIIYHMAQSSLHKVVIVYGINILYQPCMQLINWQQKRILGTVYMPYSGCWKIKHICEIYRKGDGLQFVSCGIQHLMYWQFIGQNLVYSSFGLNQKMINAKQQKLPTYNNNKIIQKDSNSQISNNAKAQQQQKINIHNITFMIIQQMQNILLAGDQQGYLYIFKQFQYAMRYKLHTGPIRSLVIYNQLIFTGGMDVHICISTIVYDQLQKYKLYVLEQHSIKSNNKQYKHHNTNNSKNNSNSNSNNLVNKQKQIKIRRLSSLQCMEPYNMQQHQLILSEQDIQAIVVTQPQSTLGQNKKVGNNEPYYPSNNINNNRNTINLLNIFVGTRSGNILLLRRKTSPTITNLPMSPSYNQLSKKGAITTHNNIALNGECIKSIQKQNPTNIQFTICENKQIQNLIYSHDNDTITSICFNEKYPDLFYLLTYSGILQIWSLKQLKCIFTYKLLQQANKIFCFKQYVIICCQRSIRTIKIDLQSKVLAYVAQMSKQYNGVITDCILSKNYTNSSFNSAQKQSIKQKEYCRPNKCKQQQRQKQKDSSNYVCNESSFDQQNLNNNKQLAYLVIGLKKNQFNQLIINQITNKIQQKFTVLNLKYQIEFMDFSRDGKYLLFKDSFQQLGMVNLQNYKRINTIFVEMQIQWESQGIRISPNGQRIYCSYSRENKITVLRRIGQKNIIIGDQMGTLRIFEYPCPEDKIGELHNQCYTHHMNFIKNIQIHPTLPYALTTAIYDRSLILWKIIKPQSEQ